MFVLLIVNTLDFSCSSRGVWDPERWHSDRKRSDTPPKEERTGRGDQITENHSKRRNNGDPRDRIRKEQDGIVLSPQRRSFNSGCFVNVNQPPSRRPESPIGKTEVRSYLVIDSFFLRHARLCLCLFIYIVSYSVYKHSEIFHRSAIVSLFVESVAAGF